MRVLIAEDDRVSALIEERTVRGANHEVVVVHDGIEALERLREQDFDALITDWMMPRMDGLELISLVRQEIRPVPLIVMVTALGSPSAQSKALNAGADEYVVKPVTPRELLGALECAWNRRHQATPGRPPIETRARTPKPPFVGVCIAASTGGPEAVKEVVASLDPAARAAWYLVVHGPAWMPEFFADALRRTTRLPTQVAENGMHSAAGNLYLAPGGGHLQVVPGSLHMQITDDPPENFVRPAADPLFSSVASSFGAFSVAVVLTGLGRDGAVGSGEIAAAGGTVLAQDPASATVPSMPQTVIDLGLAHDVVPLDSMAGRLGQQVGQLARKL